MGDGAAKARREGFAVVPPAEEIEPLAPARLTDWTKIDEAGIARAATSTISRCSRLCLKENYYRRGYPHVVVD